MSAGMVTDLTKGIYRRLYAGFIKGRRINLLSLPAEAWFWRVLASADDFGNADAEPGLCYAATVGRRKGISMKDVEKWLGELGESGLIQFYAGESGDKYLHIIGFEELQPAGKNGKRVQRFPLPGIQVNPGESSASQASHSHSHSHSDPHSDNHSHSDPETTVRRVKRSAGADGTRIPEDFAIPEGTEEWATEHAPHVDLLNAFEGFVDYWRGVPGAKGRKLDWPGTFRNRLRDLETRAPRNGSRPSKVDESLAAVNRVRQEIRNNEH